MTLIFRQVKKKRGVFCFPFYKIKSSMQLNRVTIYISKHDLELAVYLFLYIF